MIKCRPTIIIAAILATSIMCAGMAHAETFISTGTTDLFFSPNGGCTDAIVRELNSARSEILVQAYSFTAKTVAKALLNAHKRGVRVEVVLDKSNVEKKYSAADFTAHADIPTFIDSAETIAHNKIIIIDRNTLITGSFNFSKAAETSNAENLLVIKGNQPLVNAYIANYLRHRAHSEQYKGR